MSDRWVPTTSPALLQERAAAVLDAVKASSFRVTTTNLASAAKKLWPELGTYGHRHESELDEIVTAALRLHGDGTINGSGPISNGAGATSDADWPVRTVARKPVPDQIRSNAISEPAASLSNEHQVSVAHANGTAPIGVQAAREFLYRWCPEHPNATVEAAWLALQELGPLAIGKNNFETNHWYSIRRQLRGEGKLPETSRGRAPANVNGKHAPPPVVDQYAEALATMPARVRDPLNEALKATTEAELMALVANLAGVKMTGDQAELVKRLIDRARERVRAAPPPPPVPDNIPDNIPDKITAPIPDPVVRESRPDPVAPPRIAQQLAQTPNTQAATPRSTSRRDEVRISGGGDSFSATRGEDGTWRVELVATVDEETMGQLGALVWERVIGKTAA